MLRFYAVKTKTILMTEQEFHAMYPLIIGWIQKTLAQFSPTARSVASIGFRRLGQFYAEGTLKNAKVVSVPKVPVPPLSSMGLSRFSDFERLPLRGITYLDTYFVQSGEVGDESLHFHELVHVIQWRALGPEGFLATYVDGLERFRYRNNPLETIAYDLQARFDSDQRPFEVEAEVLRSLRNLRE